MQPKTMNSVSGNLADPCRFDYRGPALSLGKARGLVAICVHATKLLPVRVIDGDKPMMVLAPPVFVKSTLLSTGRFFRRSLFHLILSLYWKVVEALSQGNEAHASTVPGGYGTLSQRT